MSTGRERKAHHQISRGSVDQRVSARILARAPLLCQKFYQNYHRTPRNQSTYQSATRNAPAFKRQTNGHTEPALSIQFSTGSAGEELGQRLYASGRSSLLRHLRVAQVAIKQSVPTQRNIAEKPILFLVANSFIDFHACSNPRLHQLNRTRTRRQTGRPSGKLQRSIWSSWGGT